MYGISIIKIGRSWDRLIFLMGIHILVRRHIYTESGPWYLDGGFQRMNTTILIKYQCRGITAQISQREKIWQKTGSRISAYCCHSLSSFRYKPNVSQRLNVTWRDSSFLIEQTILSWMGWPFKNWSICCPLLNYYLIKTSIFNEMNWFENRQQKLRTFVCVWACRPHIAPITM